MMLKMCSRMLAIIFAITMVWAGSAMALPVLTITDGTTTVTVDDADNDGIITFGGTVGGWDVTMSMASSFPAIGKVGFPEMHLTGATTSYSSGGTLTFSVEDTFSAWDNNLKGLVSAFGGYANGNVTFNTYLDGTLLASFGPATGAFSEALSSLVTPIDPNDYTITIEGIIDHSNTCMSSSFDGGVAPVPEPATMILFGIGLIGIAGVTRKKLNLKRPE